LEKGYPSHFVQLAPPTLLEALVGKQELAHFNHSVPAYAGVEKRKPLMRVVKKEDSIENQSSSNAPEDYLKTAAYYLWRSRDCPWGEPAVDWQRAEKQWREQAHCIPA